MTNPSLTGIWHVEISGQLAVQSPFGNVKLAELTTIPELVLYQNGAGYFGGGQYTTAGIDLMDEKENRKVHPSSGIAVFAGQTDPTGHMIAIDLTYGRQTDLSASKLYGIISRDGNTISGAIDPYIAPETMIQMIPNRYIALGQWMPKPVRNWVTQKLVKTFNDPARYQSVGQFAFHRIGSADDAKAEAMVIGGPY